MRIFITGPVSNGKSRLALKIALSLHGPRFYVATMQAEDEECLARIARHRRFRDERLIETVECGCDIASLSFPAGSVVLLDCLTNLLSNRMFAEPAKGDSQDLVAKVARDIDCLGRQCENLVIVTNEVGSGLGKHSESTNEYIRALGELNSAVAGQSDYVCEMVCGKPLSLKGALAHGIARAVSEDAPCAEEGDGGKGLILLVGGKASGKGAYIASLGYRRDDISDAVLDDRPVLTNLQDLIAEYDGDAMELVPRLLDKELVSCREIGSGIVPQDAGLRKLRDDVGAVCTELARHASLVVRMTAGIPVELR